MTLDAYTITRQLDALFAPYHRPDAPGLVVGIAHRDQLLYRRGFGMASIEHDVANTPLTRMRIGSVSKHFTSLAALLLAEEGLLDIDAPARRYCPVLPARDRDPTLRQFMTHTGGERCFLDLSMLTQGMTMVPDGASLAMQTRQSERNFPAGSQMIYSNGGYQLLSIVIERISGKSFETFLAERIFAPMGMTDTASIPNDMTIQPRMATLHVPDPAGGWQRGLLPYRRTLGDGAIISTIDDMLRWIAHLRGDKIVGNAATWREMLTPARFANGLVSNYSLGLMQTSYRGVSLLHHSGGSIGGACQMLTIPAYALDIAIITNGALVNPVELSKRIVDIVLDGQLASAESLSPAYVTEHPAWPGTYRSRDTGAYYEIVERDGALSLIHFHFSVHPMPLTRLPYRSADDGVTLMQEGLEGPFHLQLHGGGQRLDLIQCGQRQTLERLAPAPPCLIDAASGMSGRYVSRDAAAHAIIALEGESLALHVQGEYGAAHYRLDPKADDLFVFTPHETGSLAYGAMRAVRGDDGQAMSLRLDTWRTRQLLFTRVA